MISFRAGAGLLGASICMALSRPREDRWRYSGALLSPTPCFPLLPSRGQSAVEFLLAGSRILGCPKRTPSTARPLSRGHWALIRLPFSVWTGARYWHGVGGSMFDSSSACAGCSNRPVRPLARTSLGGYYYFSHYLADVVGHF